MVVQGLAGGLRPPGPPVSAQHWVEFLEHFKVFFAKLNQLGIVGTQTLEKCQKLRVPRAKRARLAPHATQAGRARLPLGARRTPCFEKNYSDFFSIRVI